MLEPEVVIQRENTPKQTESLAERMKSLSLNVAPEQREMTKTILAAGLSLASALSKSPEELERERREEIARREREEKQRLEERATLEREQRELELVLSAKGKDPTKEIEQGNRSLMPSLMELKERRARMESQKQREELEG